MRYQAKSEANYSIWSKFILLYEANLHCDMERFSVRFEANFSIWRIFSIWSEFLLWYEANFSHDLKQSPLSEVIYFRSVLIFALVIFIVNFSLRYEAKSAVIIDFFDMKRIFVGYQTNFRAISSKIRNLKRIFRSEANLYSDMKKKNCMILSEIQYPKRNFRSEALLSCDLERFVFIM